MAGPDSLCDSALRRSCTADIVQHFSEKASVGLDPGSDMREIRVRRDPALSAIHHASLNLLLTVDRVCRDGNWKLPPWIAEKRILAILLFIIQRITPIIDIDKAAITKAILASNRLESSRKPCMCHLKILSEYIQGTHCMNTITH
jgi:hypothetical protein